MFALHFLIWLKSAKAHATMVMALFFFEVFTTGLGLSIEWSKMTNGVLAGLDLTMLQRTIFSIVVSGALSFVLTFTVSTLSENFSFGLVAISATSSAFSIYAFRDIVGTINYASFGVSDGMAWFFMTFLAFGPLIMMKVNSSKAMRGFGAEINELLRVENAEVKSHLEIVIKDRVRRMKEEQEAAALESSIDPKKRVNAAQKVLDRFKPKAETSLDALLKGTGVYSNN
jgi:hypothetical protein